MRAMELGTAARAELSLAARVQDLVQVVEIVRGLGLVLAVLVVVEEEGLRERFG